MSNTKVLHPIGILKAAVQVWAHKLLPASVCYGFCIVLAKSLSWMQPLAEEALAGWKTWAVPASFFIHIVAVFIINSLLVLIMLRYFQDKENIALTGALKDALCKIRQYLKAAALFGAFILAFLIPAALLVELGNNFYRHAPVAMQQAVKVGALLTTSTAFVILVIVGAWYGFFFSLAPLVAAFENKGPWNAMQESRKLLRGNALRSLAVFILIMILYIFVGVGSFFIITRFTYQRTLINLIDPVVAIIVGPIGVASWYLIYQKLRAIKNS